MRTICRSVKAACQWAMRESGIWPCLTPRYFVVCMYTHLGRYMYACARYVCRDQMHCLVLWGVSMMKWIIFDYKGRTFAGEHNLPHYL